MMSRVALTALWIVAAIDIRYAVGVDGVKRRCAHCGIASQPKAIKRVRLDHLEVPVIDETALPDDDDLDEIRMAKQELEAWKARQDVSARCALVRSTGDASWITPADQFTFTARQSQALLHMFNNDLFDIPVKTMVTLDTLLAGPDVHWHQAFAALDVVLHDDRRAGTLITALDLDPDTQPVRLLMQVFNEHGHCVMTRDTSLPVAVARLPDTTDAKRAIHMLARLQASCKPTYEVESTLDEAIRCRNYELIPLLLDAPFNLDPLVERGPDGTTPYDRLLVTADDIDDPDLQRAAETLCRSTIGNRREAFGDDDPDGSSVVSDTDGVDDDDDDDDDGPYTPVPEAMQRLQDLMYGITLATPVPSDVADACAICLGSVAGVLPGRYRATLPLCGHAFHWACLRPWFVRQACRSGQAFSCPLCRNDPTATPSRNRHHL
ncbi:RING-type domain-containing protein [Plasmodiophora brassicae]